MVISHSFPSAISPLALNGGNQELHLLKQWHLQNFSEGYFIQNGTFNTTAAHQIIPTWLCRMNQRKDRKITANSADITAFFSHLSSIYPPCPASQRSELA